ncbi:hypothetical protein [Parasedimentitalea huanghaiensis]|uniref:Uncharacterized protein n=1 Tax=Parasedimentitalea huanghaiensis TaxID=2682100 RepID=A0A6L6WD90_9RHOB|nr:hypothetical protein [Zongyanglinia huanghaiensis]MVO15248.1 hypothetical protein [Zongyanglinia huanghaiensis]
MAYPEDKIKIPYHRIRGTKDSALIREVLNGAQERALRIFQFSAVLGALSVFLIESGKISVEVPLLTKSLFLLGLLLLFVGVQHLPTFVFFRGEKTLRKWIDRQTCVLRGVEFVLLAGVLLVIVSAGKFLWDSGLLAGTSTPVVCTQQVSLEFEKMDGTSVSIQRCSDGIAK